MVLLWDAFVAGARTVTGLELIGLMWRALVAALVGVFWVSFAAARVAVSPRHRWIHGAVAVMVVMRETDRERRT
jgi:hypothetical protein